MIITHHFKVDTIDCSLFACWKLLVIALLFGAIIGYFIPHSCLLLKPSETNEMTKRVTRNIKQKSDIARRAYASPFWRNLQTTNATFCHIEPDCKTIKCCCILEQFDPGEVVRVFIENNFKVQCSSNVAINLILEKSMFPGNKLREMWLKTDIAIDQLILNNCFLTALSDAAFSSMIYERTTKLHLLNNNISILRRNMFRHLPNLENFAVEWNLIRQVDRNLLKDVAGTLQILRFEYAITNVQVLRNITGADDLPAVQILSLRYNYVPVIDSQLFSGVPNVASFYLCNSRVRTVHADAFESMSKSLKQLVLSGNNIASLPKGLFNWIIRQNTDFGLMLNDNPWHCDCSLEWMREMIRYCPRVIKSSLICTSPRWNANVSFASANFCDHVALTSLSTRNGETTEATMSTSSVRVNCTCHQLFRSNYSRHVFAPMIEILLSFSSFTAEQLDNGSVLITLPDTDHLFLIWFANDNMRFNISELENSIRCVSQVRGRSSYLLWDLQPRTSYTICLYGNFSFLPFNCLGLTTRSLTELNSWSNGSSVIIAVFIASLLLVCFVSAILMFVMVRRYPAMLRGSKRVIIVRHRNAIVLPKGIPNGCTVDPANNDNAISTISQNSKKNEYVTPLPLARNSTRSRRSSEQSDRMSYISGVEPTLSQWNSWRLKNRSLLNWETEPPPLPPHPHHKALSTMEEK